MACVESGAPLDKATWSQCVKIVAPNIGQGSGSHHSFWVHTSEPPLHHPSRHHDSREYAFVGTAPRTCTATTSEATRALAPPRASHFSCLRPPQHSTVVREIPNGRLRLADQCVCARARVAPCGAGPPTDAAACRTHCDAPTTSTTTTTTTTTCTHTHTHTHQTTHRRTTHVHTRRHPHRSFCQPARPSSPRCCSHRPACSSARSPARSKRRPGPSQARPSNPRRLSTPCTIGARLLGTTAPHTHARRALVLCSLRRSFAPHVMHTMVCANSLN